MTMTDKVTKLVIVGGFLGAGKTTLISLLTQTLQDRGQSVGIVTNDQAEDLVDTKVLAQLGVPVAEVAGSCFCCDFHGLVGAVRRVTSAKPIDVVLAEAVGSCTDLKATVLLPLQEYSSVRYKVRPLTVVVDPWRLTSILKGGDGGLHPSAAYIYRLQLQEAQIILINKADTISDSKSEKLKSEITSLLPGRTIHLVSGVTGQGVENWIADLFFDQRKVVAPIEVDYVRYAEGEAILGWYNASIKLTCPQEISWSHYINELLKLIEKKSKKYAAEIGHVKVFIEHNGLMLSGNIVGKKPGMSIQGNLGSTTHVSMTINARIQIEATLLGDLIRESIVDVNPNIANTIVTESCFSPSAPTPTYRIHN